MSSRNLAKTIPLQICVLIFLGVLVCPSPTPAAPAPKPLSKTDVIELLKGGVPSARVGELARDHGINFQLTSATEEELRQAGASNELLGILRDLAPKAPGIQIEATPGDAEVYVDDERVGKTSGEGRLKITKLAAGEHRIRISREGYKDFERTITIRGGESSNVTTQLEKIGTESASGGPSDASGGNVRVLLDKFVAAVGGKAKLRTIRGFRLRGDAVLYLPQGATSGQLETVFDFSGRVWQRFTNSSVTYTMVVTPDSGFLYSAAGIQDIPIIQRNELLKNIWRNAFYVAQHIDDPTFSFMSGGTAVVGGVTTEILNVAGAGTESQWFIDPRNGFIMRASWMEMGTTPAEIVDDYADWEPVAGIMIPMRQSSTRNGQTQSTGTFSGVEVNPRIDPSLFARPGQ